MNVKLLQDRGLYPFLERVDNDVAEETRKQGCGCGGRLHSARYKRKPRGGPKGLGWDHRWSFCCEREGCRRRRTPPSVRFLGRKVYLGVVVVLVAAMRHGPKGKRVSKLHEELGIDRRTLKRWQEWWLETFVETKFWRAARGHLMPPVDEKSLPLSLVERFEARTPERLVDLMKFLMPITTTWGEAEIAF